MWVYINYPVPHFSIHSDPSCSMIQMHNKPDQRYRKVNLSSLGDFLSELIDQEIRFAAKHEHNDFWIEIGLASSEQEYGLVYIIQAIIGQRYRPLANAPVHTHC